VAPTDEIAERLEEFKGSGLIADYEVLVADDSVRLRIVAPRGQDPAKVKSFMVETLAGKLSESQISIETASG
jgi:fructose 1,6-bisphosphatase